MKNVTSINLGMVAVSRGCFPVELSLNRRPKVVEEGKKKSIIER